MDTSKESHASVWIMRSFKTAFGLLAIYFAYTMFVTIDRLNAGPVQFYDSGVIQPVVKRYSEENLATELPAAEKIKFIAIVTMDKKEGEAEEVTDGIKILIPNLVEGDIETRGSLEEQILQLASGSGEAYADHCPNTLYRHVCTGPVYDGGKMVSPKTCKCVFP